MPLVNLQSAALGLALIKLAANPEIIAEGQTGVTFSRPAGVVTVKVEVIAVPSHVEVSEGF